MTDAYPRYRLWDVECGKLLASSTEVEPARDLCQSLIRHVGRAYADELALVIDRGQPGASDVLTGAELISWAGV